MSGFLGPALDYPGEAWAWFLYISAHPAFGVILYALWAICRLLMGINRIARYILVERQTPLLLIGIADIAQFVAFIVAALIVAPYSALHYIYLLPFARLAWLVGLVFFAAATHLEGLFIVRHATRRSV